MMPNPHSRLVFLEAQGGRRAYTFCPPSSADSKLCSFPDVVYCSLFISQMSLYTCLIPVEVAKSKPKGLKLNLQRSRCVKNFAVVDIAILPF